MPVCRLPVRPDFKQLHRQAKELLRALHAGEANAIRQWREQQSERAESSDPATAKLADAQAQQDPTFRTRVTYTRLTAQAAFQALREQGYSEDHLPSPSTMAEVLNRMGFRLRKVLKAKPQKKIKETDAIFDNIKKKMKKPKCPKG